PRWAIEFELESGAACLPAESPEIPPLAAEIDLLACAVARDAITGDDSIGHRAWRPVVSATQLGSETIVVVGDIALVGSFLHCEDLALVAFGALVSPLDHHRELALLEIRGDPIADEAVVINELEPFARDELSGAIEVARGLAVRQRIEDLVAPVVSAGRRFERGFSGPRSDVIAIAGANLPLVQRIEFEPAGRRVGNIRGVRVSLYVLRAGRDDLPAISRDLELIAQRHVFVELALGL